MSDVKVSAEVKALRKKADKGDARAQAQLGDLYFRGVDVAEDQAEGCRWWQRAADQGHRDALDNLAFAYSKGVGVALDLTRARDLYQKLVDLGDGNSRAPLEWLNRELAKAGGAGTPKRARKPPVGRAAQRRAAAELAGEVGLGRRSARVAALIADSISLAVGGKASGGAGKSARGGSRLGGDPDLPAGTPWPTGPRGPLSFVAQIDLGGLSRADHGGALPTSGLLSFFYDVVTLPARTASGDGCRVLYTRSTRGVAPRRPPAALRPPNRHTAVRFTAQPLGASATVTLPSLVSAAAQRLKLGDDDADRYDDLIVRLAGLVPGSRGHRMLGHPHVSQDDLFASLPRRARGDAWTLLLQIETDASAKMNWGEGTMYFVAGAKDLARGAFDAVIGLFEV